MLAMRSMKFMISLLLTTGMFAGRASSKNVSYDSRALLIEGKHRVLISGSIHYPRSTPEMWPDLIQKSKDGGLDVIETYVFWNLHEPVRNQYDFHGRNDLLKFVKSVAEADLYVFLRIGPYVCAEWNYGGFPLWLHSIPGIQFRTNNEPFKEEMQRFTTKIVNMMKKEKLFAAQGGPIILAQIENEYGNIDAEYGSSAISYIKWAATMATSLDTGVPWVMCQQADAPDPMINTCNGFYCDQFTPNTFQKPKMWTENWSGWYLSFGGRTPYRPTKDLAFAIARFFQRGGTFQNYYMYHGGTNFGRTTGGPFIATSYDYDAPIDEYGILRQPKWGHLKDLHQAIKLCEDAMVATSPDITSIGTNLEASVYKTNSGLCSAFLANIGTESDANVNFSGISYHLPPWSVSILPDCKTVAHNTAKINAASVLSVLSHQPIEDFVDSSKIIQWSTIDEPVGISMKDSFIQHQLLEQINTTADKSDYLWYSVSTEINGNENFLENGLQTVLHINSLGHVLHAFVNKKFAGSGTGSSSNRKISVNISISLKNGKNTIDLLSLTVGLQNYGAYFDTMGAGITGPVMFRDSKNNAMHDLSPYPWTYQVGLQGEKSGLPEGSSSEWKSQSTVPKQQPLIWYKCNFKSPDGTSPIALNLKGMGKGMAWVNGQSIGRYWPAYMSPPAGCTNCSYKGRYQSDKCLKNCGNPSQQLYHVPRSWLLPDGNILVLFEEIGGDPTQIRLSTRKMNRVCSHISQSYPPPIQMWGSSLEVGVHSVLECPFTDQLISSIEFADFGTPSGTCGDFSHGRCNTTTALSIVQKECVGLRSCKVRISADRFGEPCEGVNKSLAIEALCT